MNGSLFISGCKTCEVHLQCLLDSLKPGSWVQGLFAFQVERGETIFTQGTPSVGWYILCGGVAKLVLRTRKGEKFVIRFCKAPELLNFTADDVHPYSAVAVRGCRGIVLPKRALLAMYREQPEFFSAVPQRFSF